MAGRLCTRLRRWFNAVLRRYAGVQVVRAVPNLRVYARAPNAFTLRGVRLDLSEGWVTPTLRQRIYDRSYEAREAEIVEATLRPEDRVSEIGCGIGFVATIASRITRGAVRCYDADPRIADAARRTIDRNGAAATVAVGVLQRSPTAETTDFYVCDDFWASSLVPNPQSEKITVPVLDFEREISEHGTSYLIVDIEGGETALLTEPIPLCVTRLCVECHPAVSEAAEISAMLISLLSQGFSMSLDHSRPAVFYFAR